MSKYKLVATKATKMDDPYNLQRFVDAQNPILRDVLSELGRGRKESHWMWFVFPQLKGLGHSQMARTFGISSREEAEAYLRHSVLGPRLRECTRLVNLIEGSTADQIFGNPDSMKFRSSMTLFAEVASDAGVFGIFNDALEKYFGGTRDPPTRERL